ncbi:MAG: hypothetical protein EXR11_13955 [Rhodospirillaceae bacterium]|nr:hypothetical protein [Rhodospirillaceae bacterium]
MIFLFTDFGGTGPYVGQVQAVLARNAPGVSVIELMSDLPAFDIKAAAYLLPAYCTQAQPGDVVLAVVDPGVGSARLGVVVEVDGVWFVGPDNGLFSLAIRRAKQVRAWALPEASPLASATFHGRDVFAPVAARLALGQAHDYSPIDPNTLDRPDWPDDWPAIIYVDSYGNAMTGLRVNTIQAEFKLTPGGPRVPVYRTFSDAKPGEAFVYANANGLWEFAINGGNAAQVLGLKPRVPIYCIYSAGNVLTAVNIPVRPRPFRIV